MMGFEPLQDNLSFVYASSRVIADLPRPFAAPSLEWRDLEGWDRGYFVNGSSTFDPEGGKNGYSYKNKINVTRSKFLSTDSS